MKLKISSWFLLLSVFAAAGPLHAGGMSTSFSDVVIRDIPLGKIFIVPGPTGGGLVVQNTGASPILIKTQVLTPNHAQLRRGASPIPNLSWVRLDPEELLIPPQGQGAVHIQLLIPPYKKHAEKTYQIMILTREIPQNKVTVQVTKGLLSRLTFSTQK